MRYKPPAKMNGDTTIITTATLMSRSTAPISIRVATCISSREVAISAEPIIVLFLNLNHATRLIYCELIHAREIFHLDLFYDLAIYLNDQEYTYD